MPEESVLAIPTSYFNEVVGTPSGGFINVKPEEYALKLCNDKQIVFIERSKADADEGYKQIIPYTLLAAVDPASGIPMLFRYKRGKKGGEQRLHDLYSIGVGGHVTEDDWDWEHQVDGEGKPLLGYYASMIRELEEETTFSHEQDFSHWPAGIIYDPTTPVGRVHVGIAHVVRVKDMESVGSNSPEVLDAEWVKANRFKAGDSATSYEPWSQIVLRQIIAGKITI